MKGHYSKGNGILHSFTISNPYTGEKTEYLLDNEFNFINTGKSKFGKHLPLKKLPIMKANTEPQRAISLPEVNMMDPAMPTISFIAPALTINRDLLFPRLPLPTD